MRFGVRHAGMTCSVAHQLCAVARLCAGMLACLHLEGMSDGVCVASGRASCLSLLG